ncbi:hypothetical protein [Butyrivibrio sp. MC2021]|uniref:hypothetical protein n=1 Tax=Butyrivibrio sp. MC2021 TaxID=1408306 RepID=UPI00055E1000|nr:hypothetical protein [Butyrivibrio sp. MC2021]
MRSDGITMTYSAIVRDKDNKKIVRVSFERGGALGKEIAEGLLPECKITRQNGYSQEEILGLEEYLRANQEDIMDKAKVISNPLKWL